MANILLSIMVGIGSKLLTERFMSALIVRSLRALADRTENKIDDKLVSDLAQALEVPD